MTALALVASPLFERGVQAVIAVNAAVVLTEFATDSHAALLDTASHVILGIYVVELATRVAPHRCAFLRQR